LVEKNLRHAIVEVGVSNEGFAAWLQGLK
jgi:hypothetical protein